MTIQRMTIVGWAAVLMLASSASAAVKYVKTAATGTGDCGMWANACTLTNGLSAAQSGDELWCKEGTYSLTQPLILKNGVKIIGGFAGSETLAKNSNPTTRVTILDGGGTVQPVIGSDNSASAVLRGFTIKNGLAEEGGGIILENSSALIVQCIFENNRASDFGGAAVIKGSGSPQFINTIFRDNGETATTGTKGGGAVFVYRGSPQFVNCLFHNNKAMEGGAVLVAFGTPTFINTTIADNEATISYGGGISDQNGNATLKNCIVWSNDAAKQGPVGVQIFSGSGGSSLATYSDIEGGWVGATNINSDPLFGAPASSNYTLQSGSPCKDAGENAALPPDAGNLDWDMDTDEITPKDLAGKARTFLGSQVDMGPYESNQVED